MLLNVCHAIVVRVVIRVIDKRIQLIFHFPVIRHSIVVVIIIIHIRDPVAVGVGIQCSCGDDVIHAADEFFADILLCAEMIFFGCPWYGHRFEGICSHGDCLHFIRFHPDAEELR